MRIVVSSPVDFETSGRQADLLDRIRISEQRLTEIREESCRLRGEVVSEEEVKESLEQFDPVWESLSPREQARVMALMIERVDYDGDTGTVAVNFFDRRASNSSRKNLRRMRHEGYEDRIEHPLQTWASQ
jgi:hypothetical protein